MLSVLITLWNLIFCIFVAIITLGFIFGLCVAGYITIELIKKGYRHDR